MADRWIISHRNFREHDSVGYAQTELARLSAAFPEKKFKIMRVKTTLKQSDAPKIIADLSDALAALLKVNREQDTGGVMPADKAIAYGRAEAILAEYASLKEEAA